MSTNLRYGLAGSTELPHQHLADIPPKRVTESGETLLGLMPAGTPLGWKTHKTKHSSIAKQICPSCPQYCVHGNCYQCPPGFTIMQGSKGLWCVEPSVAPQPSHTPPHTLYCPPGTKKSGTVGKNTPVCFQQCPPQYQGPHQTCQARLVDRSAARPGTECSIM